MAELIEIKVKLEKIIFKKEETSFIIGNFENEEEMFVAKGNLPLPAEGKTYILRGFFIVDRKYGEQFNFQSATEVMPENEDDIEALLTSDIIKGVGPKTAKLIISKFGKETLDIIENNYKKLELISGIGEKKAKEIHESYVEHIEFAHVSLKLQKMGIETRYVVSIYELYGGTACEAIKENPYTLVDDIFGISFNKAEEIARNIDFPENSTHRIEAAILYSLKQEVSKGHTFMFRKNLLSLIAEELEINKEEIENSLNTLAIFGKVKIDVIENMELVYPWKNYLAEQTICKKLVSLMGMQRDLFDFDIDIDEEISLIEEKEHIYLSEEQRDGVKTALQSNISIITGGPGTGKTTIINTILKILEKFDENVALAAPTGRAAKRITESSGKIAYTIHRLLEFHYSEDDFAMTFGKNEENLLDYETVIIDEASMVDLMLMEGFCRALNPKTRLIMVGDVDQLPPVGAGSILQDILGADCFPQVRLKEIFRQARESQIIVSAHAINKGEMITSNKKDGDFFFINEFGEKALETVVNLAQFRLATYLENTKGAEDIQVLTPMKKGALGTYNLNKLLQEVWNPKNKDKKEITFGEKIFREGDKVIQMKNNYSIEYKIFVESDFLKPKYEDGSEGQGIFNGDIGYIVSINLEYRKVTVIFDKEKYVEYEGDELEQIELAYALTVHKSQGSEFRAVIMPITGIPRMLATRNLLYTGITRGKELVTLVGDRKLLEQMIKNKIDKDRNSALDIRIRDLALEKDTFDILFQ